MIIIKTIYGASVTYMRVVVYTYIYIYKIMQMEKIKKFDFRFDGF